MAYIMYFQLMAASMFDLPKLPVTSSRRVSTRVLDLENGGNRIGNLMISRSNHESHDIPYASGLTAAILILCGRGLNYDDTQDIKKNVLAIPTDW